MIGRQTGEGLLDLQAVQRDEDLLAAIAARGHVDPADEVARLLSGLAADVDDGLTELLDAPVRDPQTVLAAAPTVPGHRRAERPGRRRTAYATVAAVVAGATLSVSGVAAAVTGDPFAAYAAVGAVLPWGEDDLPPNAGEVARLQRALAGARADLARGDVEAAQTRLEGVRARLDGLDLRDGQRAAVERRLQRLGDRLERASARPARHPDGTGTPGPDKDPAEPDGPDEAQDTARPGKAQDTSPPGQGAGHEPPGQGAGLEPPGQGAGLRAARARRRTRAARARRRTRPARARRRTRPARARRRTRAPRARRRTRAARTRTAPTRSGAAGPADRPAAGSMTVPRPRHAEGPGLPR